MKIACFSPLPPRRSGISDYTRELVPELRAAGAEVDLWLGEREPEPHGVEGFRIVRYPAGGGAETDTDTGDAVRRLGSYDALLYHFGNDAAYHADMFEMFCRAPGVVVLHDVVLHHFLRRFLDDRGAGADYARELERAAGPAGRAFERWVRRGGSAALSRVDAHHLPLHHPVLEIASGVIVHSETAREAVHAVLPQLAVAKIHHFGPPLGPPADPAALRRRLGLPERAVVVAAFGHFVANKRVEIALEAIGSLGSPGSNQVHVLLVGEPQAELRAVAQRLGWTERVTWVPWVDLAAMNDYLAATDLVINLRHPTMGETSGVACRALAAGKACVVSDTGWFAELPDDVAVKIGVGRDERRDLRSALRHLVADATARQALGDRARRFSAEHHDPRRAAHAYLEFLAATARPAEPLRLVLYQEVVAALGSWGVRDTDSTILAPLEAQLDRIFRPGPD